jgi:DNA-binding MarR family transcriptional regulator
MAIKSPSAGEIHEAISCLRRLTEAFGKRRRQLALAAGLTEHQWRVLEEISSEHFMPSMFARSRESSPAAVSKTLRQLANKGLISASVSKADGRQRKYVLTARGRRTLDNLRLRREEAIAHVWVGLDARPLRTFTQFGNRLTQRLEEYARRAARD